MDIGSHRGLAMRITRRILAWSLALVLAGQGVAQAATYYYYRGGAQATEPSGTKPASPAPQGTFAILIDAPEIGIRGTGYSATTYAYSNVGPVVFSVNSGALPAGISINATTGTISGSPSAVGTSSVVIQGVDTSTGAVATTTLAIEIDDPFSISGTPGTLVQKNTPYSADFTLDGGGQPYGFSVGALPPGLAFNAGATSANIGGLPTTTGTYNITVTGSDKHGLAAQYPYTLQVYDTLAITGSPPATATVGTPYSGQLMVTGGAAPYTYAISAGTLPTGVTLKTTGIISGTPAISGTKSGIKVKVSDATGQSAISPPFSISVAASGSQPLTISVMPVTTGRENKAYTTQYTAGGGSGSYSFSMVGSPLPPGLTFNSNSGLISGAPLNGSAGSYPDITAKVVDATSHEAVAAPFTLTISPAQVPLSVTGTPPASIQVGSPYAAQFSGSGGSGAGYVFALASGSLPPGLSLSPTGMLSGTPSTTGSYTNLKIRITDNASNTALSNGFNINVVAPPPLTISGNPPSNVIAGDSYSATWTAFDGSGAGYHYTSVGTALPPGLSLSDINGAQGLLSGIATTSGTYAGLQIRVTDSLGNIATTGAFTLNVTAPPPPPPPQTPLALFGSPSDAVYGQPYSVTFSGGGGAPSYVYSIAGTLPAGLSLDPFSGVLSGTPTQIGNFPGLQVTVTDSVNDTASGPVFAINVADPNPLSISWTPQTNWQVNDFVAILPDTVGGDSGNYTYSTIGTLPPGLSLFSNGTLFGNLTEFGTFGPFQIQVSDGVRTATTQAVTFTVAAPGLFVSGFPAANADENQAYSAQFSAQGGTGAGYVFSMNGTLPAGLSLDPNSGLVAGTPAIGSAGTYSNLSVHVTDDGSNIADSATFSITVHPLPTLVVSGTPPTTSTLGGNYSTTFSASGGTSTGYVFSIDAGTLPTGLALAPDGTLSGSPTAVGTFGPIIVKVTDSANLTAQSSPFSIQVVDDNPLSITWSPTAVYAVGDPVSIVSTPAGGIPANYVFGYTGTLPTGVTQNPSTGTLSGTASAAGTFGPITVTITDGLRNAATAPATFTINGIIAITGSPSTDAAVGVPYSAQFSATGGTGTGLVYTSTGTTLPAGLTLDPSSGLLSGTPTASGTVTGIVIRVTDDAAHSASSAPFQIAVADALTLSSSTPAGSAGNAYSGSFSAIGGRAPFSYAVTLGTLPTGLALDPSSGLLTGTPSSADTQTFTITVTDANANTATKQVTLTINAATALASLTTATTVRSGAAINGTLASSLSTPAWTLASVPASPALGLTGSGSSFVGTAPSVAASTSYDVTATATKGAVSADAAPFTVTVLPALTIAGTPNGTISGTPGNTIATTAAPIITGNQGTLSYALLNGGSPITLSSVCPGLAFSTAAGTVSGTPTGTCNSGTLTIRVTDATDGATATSVQSFTISIAAGSAVATLTTPATVHSGAAVAGTLTTSISSPTWTFSTTPSSPALTLTDNGDDTFSGVAPGTGADVSYTVTARASGGGVDVDASSFTVLVKPPFALSGGPSGTVIGTVGTALSTPPVPVSNAIGTATYTLDQTGAPTTISSLCPGLTLGAGGIITGTPSGSCDVADLTISATDPADGSTATQSASFALSIMPAVTFSGTPTTAAQGESYSFDLTSITSGGKGGYIYTLQSGTLPTGMTLAAGTVTATSVTGNTASVTIRATDSEGRFKDATLTFAVTGATASAALTSATTVHPGAPVSGTLTSSYSSPVWSFAQTPTSPALGMTASGGGSFSGTAPSVITQTDFSIVATASQGGVDTSAAAVSVTVKPALSITGGPSGSVAGTSGTTLSSGAPSVSNAIGSVSFVLLQTGSPYADLATACSGLSFSAANGQITGTPTAPCGVSDLTIRATDASDSTTATTASPFSITVVDPPVVISGAAGGAFYGQAYNAQFTASGGSGTGFSFTLAQGSLPPGLSLSSSGLISGTPTDFSTATGLRLQVTDSRSNTALTAPFAIAVADPNPMSVSWSPQTTYLTGAPVSITVTVSGGNPANYAFSNSGVAVAGLTVNPATGAVTGSLPSAGTYGPMQITATDGVRTVTTSSLSFTASDPTATATLTSPAVARTGQTISGTLTTNIPAPSWSFASTPSSPAIPLAASGTTFSGTAPSVASPTPYSVVATATGMVTADAPSITMTIAPTLTVNGGASGTLSGQVGFAITPTSPVSFGTTSIAANPTLQILNGGSVWSIASHCGLTLNADGSISGTPTSGCAASNLVIRATDSDGAIAQTDPFSISINAAPSTPVGSFTATAPVNAAYSSPALAASGGTAPYVWSIASGALPPGLSLVPSTGAITGTPTTTGNYTFTVNFTDALGAVSPASSQQTIAVTSTPTPTGTVVASATAGVYYSSSGLVAGTGGVQPYTWSLASGYLPIGLSLNSSTGAITGTPTDVGSWSFTVRLTDSLGSAGNPTGVYSIAVGGSSAPAPGAGGTCGGSPYVPTNITLGVLPNTPGRLIIDTCWGFSFHNGAGTNLAQVPPSMFTQGVPSTVSTPPGGVSFACDGPIVYPETQTYSIANGWTTVPAIRSCNLYSAPVVTPAFLNQLAAGGYQYVVVYPMTNNDNGRALVIWNSSPLDLMGPSQQGIARISGMQFQNQYPSKTYQYTTCDERGLCIYPTGATFTYTNDDSIGQYFAQLSSPELNSTVRGYIQFGAGLSWEGVPTTFAAIIHDDWLRQTATAAPAGYYASSVQAGSSYSSQISGSGTWALTSGSLPPGLSLNASTGAISGVPTVTGTYSFAVSVSANGITSTPSATQTITVSAATVTASLNAATIRAGDSFSGTLTSSMASPSWSVASDLPVSVSGNTFSGTAASTGTYSITPTASANGYTQTGSAASLSVVGPFGLSAAGNVSGNAGLTMTANGPAVLNRIGTASYALLQNGSAANLSALCPGLSFSTATATISGQPTTTCSQSNFTVFATDSYDGQTATSNAFSVSIGGFVVTPGSMTYTASGSFPVPVYNTITIQIWGGGASGSTSTVGYDGNSTTVPAFNLVAGGGHKSTTTGANIGPGGVGGTATGGNLANIPGNAGGVPSPLGTQAAGYSGKGGDAPYGGVGGAAVYNSSSTLGTTVAGNPGQAPGGGGSGSAVTVYCGGGGPCISKAPGGGSGGYVKHIINVTDPGAPAFGSAIGFTISGATATPTGSSGYGARGQATFTIN